MNGMLPRLNSPAPRTANELVPVTLGSEAQLLTRHAALGGKLIRIAISRADPIGEKTGWHAAMPVTQWIWTKP